MTDLHSLELDQFVPAAPVQVWRAFTEPGLLARWWAAGDLRPEVGHEFHLEMGGWGQVPCKVTEVRAPELLAFTFADWTLTFRFVAEGTGTRVLLTHAGFDLDDPQHRFAFDQMGPGWRDEVLPRLLPVVEGLPA